jgi:hypothetical protein
MRAEAVDGKPRGRGPPRPGGEVRTATAAPVSTKSTARLPHCEHTSRRCHSGIGVSAPCRRASSAGSGSARCRQSRHQTTIRAWAMYCRAFAPDSPLEEAFVSHETVRQWARNRWPRRRLYGRDRRAGDNRNVAEGLGGRWTRRPDWCESVGVPKTPDVDRRTAVSSSHMTPRWREMDSNHRSPRDASFRDRIMSVASAPAEKSA